MHLAMVFYTITTVEISEYSYGLGKYLGYCTGWALCWLEMWINLLGSPWKTQNWAQSWAQPLGFIRFLPRLGRGNCSLAFLGCSGSLGEVRPALPKGKSPQNATKTLNFVWIIKSALSHISNQGMEHFQQEQSWTRTAEILSWSIWMCLGWWFLLIISWF